MKTKPRHATRAMLMDILVLLLSALFLGFLLYAPLAYAEAALTPEEARLWEAYQSGELIRLHIVAHSDSEEDQQVKLLVRDALLSAFGQAMIDCASADEAYSLLQQSCGQMERIAARCARNNGFSGEVSAQVGLLELPEKTYGHVTLPAGNYRALRVTLGDGAGRNWWCILFPRLCLAVADTEPWQSTPSEQAASTQGFPDKPQHGTASPEQPVTEPLAATPEAAASPQVIWGSQRILACWPMYVPNSDAGTDAAAVVDTIGHQ